MRKYSLLIICLLASSLIFAQSSSELPKEERKAQKYMKHKERQERLTNRQFNIGINMVPLAFAMVGDFYSGLSNSHMELGLNLEYKLKPASRFSLVAAPGMAVRDWTVALLLPLSMQYISNSRTGFTASAGLILGARSINEIGFYPRSSIGWSWENGPNVFRLEGFQSFQTYRKYTSTIVNPTVGLRVNFIF